MGIADIFEALTAKDRPYKKGKTLSESLEILGRMKLNNHVDPDLFDIFVRRKVYRRYAEMFLDPEQIDEVDEAQDPRLRRPDCSRSATSGGRGLQVPRKALPRPSAGSPAAARAGWRAGWREAVASRQNSTARRT